MAITYNAFMRAAAAALAAEGYRVARGTDHHYTVIQSVALTVGWLPAQIKAADAFRKKRNLASYEQSGLVSVEEASEMDSLARQLHRDVRDWLIANFPQLV